MILQGRGRDRTDQEEEIRSSFIGKLRRSSPCGARATGGKGEREVISRPNRSVSI